MSTKSIFHTPLTIITDRPPINGMQVEHKTDLLSIDTRINYMHKMVWVKEEKAFYYLNSGTGAEEGDWLKYETVRSKIFAYDARVAYEKDDAVYIGGVVYIAKESVAIGEDPVSTPSKWLQIAGGGGSSAQFRIDFTNTNSVSISTPKTNPHISVYVGNELVEANVLRRSDTDFDVSFHKNVTGFIIV